MDLSVRYENFGLKINIFWPELDMPKFEGIGDAILIRNAKVTFSLDFQDHNLY